MAKAAFNKIFFSSKVDLNLRRKVVKCYIWSIALYGAETWTLQWVDKKYVENFEMWCWRRMEKISWTDCVRNGIKEERNIIHAIKRWKANWIGHILQRKCLLKHVIEGQIEGRIEMMGRQGRRCTQLLENFKGMRGYRKLKAAAVGYILENSLWKKLLLCLKTDYRMNEWMNDHLVSIYSLLKGCRKGIAHSGPQCLKQCTFSTVAAVI